MCLLPEVANLFELFNGQLPRLIGGLAGTGYFAAGPGLVVAGIACVLAGVDKPARQFVQQIGLFDQVAAGFGK